MDNHEIKAVLTLFVNTKLKRKLYGLPNGPASLNHIGDEWFDGTEYQWWRVSFGMGTETQVFSVRVSYSKFIGAVQIELYGLKSRVVYTEWDVKHASMADRS